MQKLNREYKPSDDELFMQVDGITEMANHRMQIIREYGALAERSSTEESILGYALGDYFKFNNLLDKMYPNVDGTPRVSVAASPEDLQKLQELIDQHHDVELSKVHGHVTQVWYDGEITSQKSGDLLWQRNIHSSAPGFPGVDLPVKWPETTYGGKGYIFTANAMVVRKAILDIVLKSIIK